MFSAYLLVHQFGYKDTMGDCVKGLPEVKWSGIHWSSLNHQASRYITDGNQDGQAWFALGKSALAVAFPEVLYLN